MTKKNKFLVVFFLLISLLVVVAGCGKEKSNSDSSGDAANNAETNEIYTLRFAHGYSTASQHHANVLWVKEQLEERSNGRIKVEIYPAAQLMPIDQEIPALLDGRIDADLSLSTLEATFEETFYLFDMPFLFNTSSGDLSHIQKFLKSSVFDGVVKDAFEKKGLKLWPSLTDFPAVYATNPRPVRSSEEFAGLKMRTLGGEWAQQVAKSFGYSAVSISGSELPTALMQGTVDGAITYPIYIYDNKLPLKYMTFAPLNVVLTPMQMSAKYFNSLPEDLQQIVEDVGNELLDWSIKEVEVRMQEVKGDLNNKGYETIELTDQDFVELKNKSKVIWDKFAEEVQGGRELIEEAQRLAP